MTWLPGKPSISLAMTCQVEGARLHLRFNRVDEELARAWSRETLDEYRFARYLEHLTLGAMPPGGAPSLVGVKTRLPESLPAFHQYVTRLVLGGTVGINVVAQHIEPHLARSSLAGVTWLIHTVSPAVSYPEATYRAYMTDYLEMLNSTRGYSMTYWPPAEVQGVGCDLAWDVLLADLGHPTP